ncbi:digestive cysteine proteinase 2 [Galendromus occidentalis]|uniref:Digestive cysteine proteinase 2 n=1 Tax=Galendromus occidentalis TaxID=34638 RepID=A0AAJ7SGS7_9ACAR|nr:digestive cysteine proteinase 2 [Galendromus occidentalis]
MDLMEKTFDLAISSIFFFIVGVPAPSNEDPAPPTFADAYTASGFILLPYATLREPFTANYDAKQKKSRIDYYDGTMKTFQINTPYTESPNGANFKIVWSPNRAHVVEEVCYQANATEAAPVNVQSVFPDLHWFKFAGEVDCADGLSDPNLVAKKKCMTWTNVTTNFGRNSTYTFYAIKDKDTYIPVRYTMLGYDSLFGSHYDLYEMIYTSYTTGAQDATVFDVVKVAAAGRCVPYPEGSGLSSGHLFNPMRVFIHRDESHVDEHFEHFKKQHSKRYEDADNEKLRKDNFRNNQRYIDSMNRKNKDFKLRINHLADLHQDEMKFLRGRKYVAGPNGGKVFPAENFIGRELPDSVDWKPRGVVTEVKDQAICGSCWSFGATGNIEGMYARKHGKLVRFSEQQLIDCSWKFGNGGCDGGQDYQAYQYIMQHGLSTDKEYGAYMGIDGKCHDGPALKRELPTLLGYVNVTGENDLKRAVAFVGPISVGIFAALPSLSFYHTGIFNDKDCKNGLADLDHAVLAVGYGVSHEGEAFWIVKNSWSTLWGDDGYVKIAMKNNICGVTTAATYALVP